MTLSQIRSQVDALCRKYHRELAIYRATRVASEIAQLWMIAVANRQPKPRPFFCVRKFVEAGFRLTTYMEFQNYLQRCIDEDRFPEIRPIITTLLPWTANRPWLHRVAWNLPDSA